MTHCSHKSGIYMKRLKLMICRPEGRLTGDRVGDLFACKSCAKMPGYDAVNRFHDFRGVTGIDIDFQDMKAMAREEAFVRRSQPPIKACYLVSNPAIYGVVRMYKAMMDGCGVDVHVSKHLHELAEELGVSQDQLDLKDSAASDASS